MSPFTFIVLLAFSLTATEIAPIEARHKTSAKRKAITDRPLVREPLKFGAFTERTPIRESSKNAFTDRIPLREPLKTAFTDRAPIKASRRQMSDAPDTSNNPDEPQPASPEHRLPISKSLARKLSEMLAIAVAEAVAQVVEDEPSKLIACSALLRRRNSNFNQNYNYNQNVNQNDMRYPIVYPLNQEDEDEGDYDDESGDFESTEDDEMPEIYTGPKELLAKLQRGSRSEVKRPIMRQKGRSRNTNTNINQNINTLTSGRKEEPRKNDASTGSEEGSNEDVTTAIPQPEVMQQSRRRFSYRRN